jgi:hypothetical protein
MSGRLYQQMSGSTEGNHTQKCHSWQPLTAESHFLHSAMLHYKTSTDFPPISLTSPTERDRNAAWDTHSPSYYTHKLIAGQCQVNTDTYWRNISAQQDTASKEMDIAGAWKQKSKLNPTVQKYANPLENRAKENKEHYNS